MPIYNREAQRLECVHGCGRDGSACNSRAELAFGCAQISDFKTEFRQVGAYVRREEENGRAREHDGRCCTETAEDH